MQLRNTFPHSHQPEVPVPESDAQYARVHPLPIVRKTDSQQLPLVYDFDIYTTR